MTTASRTRTPPFVVSLSFVGTPGRLCSRASSTNDRIEIGRFNSPRRPDHNNEKQKPLWQCGAQRRRTPQRGSAPERNHRAHAHTATRARTNQRTRLTNRAQPAAVAPPPARCGRQGNPATPPSQLAPKSPKPTSQRIRVRTRGASARSPVAASLPRPDTYVADRAGLRARGVRPSESDAL